MPTIKNDRTYRLWGLPAGVSIEGAELILQTFFDSDFYKTEPRVHSLSLDPYTFGRNVEVIATVTFSQTTLVLVDGNLWKLDKYAPYKGSTLKLSLTIETTFAGLTPLNTITDDEDHKVE